MVYCRQDLLVQGKSLANCPDNYVVVDIETTGLDAVNDEITEIAVVKYRMNRRVDELVTLVKPQEKISSFITGLTGISDATVADAPPIQEVILAVKNFIGDDIIVGYNVTFDLSFLSCKLEECCGLALNNDYVDVMQLAKKKLPFLGRVKQIDVAKYFSIATEGAHRAANDCLVCNQCYQKLKQLAVPYYQLPPVQIELQITAAAEQQKPFTGKHLVFLGVPNNFYIKNLLAIIREMGGCIDAPLSEATDMVIVGTGDAAVYKNTELVKAVAWKNQGAELTILKDDVFVKALHSRDWLE